MKNVHEVLREKELDLIRVRQQVEALRFVAPMLTEHDAPFTRTATAPWPEANQKNRWPLNLENSPKESLG